MSAEAIERCSIAPPTAVVAVTRPFCEHIDRIRAASPATVLLPNGTLEQFFADGARDAERRFGVPDDAFLVTFAGTLGIAQALPSALEAAERLTARRLRVRRRRSDEGDRRCARGGNAS